MSLQTFMRRIADETYPEPRSQGHDHITARMLPLVCAHVTGRRVLDVGCGQGVALESFSTAGYQALGIALNKEDVRACVAQGFDACEMDQNAMPEDFTGSFALVWARHVLEHSIAPYFTLTEFARVLSPGGILYVETPAPDTACLHDVANQNHYSVLGWRMLSSLIIRAGFEILDARQIGIVTEAGDDIYFSFTARKK